MRTVLLAMIVLITGCQGETSQGTSEPATPPALLPEKKLLLTYDIRDSRGESQRLPDAAAQKLVTQLTQRLNPTQANGITVQVRDESTLEVSMPTHSPETLRTRLRNLLSQTGFLEFRALANPTAHPELLAAFSKVTAPDAEWIVQVRPDGSQARIGRWVQISREPASDSGQRAYRYVPCNDIVRNAGSGKLISLEMFEPETEEPGLELAQYLETQNIPDIQVLVVTGDGCQLTGSMISSATSLASDGQSIIDIHFTTPGVTELAKLTRTHKPVPELDLFCKMAVILDNQILTAPRIMEELHSNRALISGHFNAEEVEEIAAILRSGSLPKGLTLQFREEQVVSPAHP